VTILDQIFAVKYNLFAVFWRFLSCCAELIIYAVVIYFSLWVFQIRNWSHIATRLVLVGATSSKRPKSPSFQIRLGLKSGRLFFK